MASSGEFVLSAEERAQILAARAASAPAVPAPAPPAPVVEAPKAPAAQRTPEPTETTPLVPAEPQTEAEREAAIAQQDYRPPGVPDDAIPLTGAELTKLVIACSYSWFMWNLMYTTVVPMLPYYAAYYGLTSLHQGIILASLQMGFLLGVTAMNITRMSPQWLVHIGAACYVIGPATIAVNPGLYTMVLGRFIEGFGAAFLVISHDSTLARKVPASQKGRAFGIKGAIGTSGLFFGPIVGGFLFQMGGLRLPMIIITIMGVFGIFIYCWLLPPKTFRERNEVLGNGSTLRYRYAHFFRNQLLSVLMCIQMLTFILVGILFLAVPDFLSAYWKVSMLYLTLMWVCWDVMKCIGSFLGGYCADKGNPWITCFGGLIIQSFIMMTCSSAAESAMNEDGKQDWKFYWFVFSVGTVFSLGTTVDGFIGGPFVKLMTEVERQLGKNCYEELFSISCSVVACGEAVGNLYCGFVYQALGFGLTLYSFAWFQLIGMVVCGYCMQGMVRPLFDKQKRALDSDDHLVSITRNRRPDLAKLKYSDGVREDLKGKTSFVDLRLAEPTKAVPLPTSP